MDSGVKLLFCLGGLILTENVAFPYENIALNKSAWQQYPFNSQPYAWGADKAVDGLFTDRSASGSQCTISANNKRTSEWWVDLRDVYSIHHITIYYRTDNLVWDERNGHSSRFLGFSIYISNTTKKDEGILCFKDTNYTRATIPNVTTIDCVKHGRYVIFYNERLQGVTYPDGYSQYAYNELCEFEVYGCPTSGVYGENCIVPCPKNCQEGHCNIVDGTCLGCVAGYKGSRCEEESDSNTYGLECSKHCGNCSNREQRNHVNGSCLNGCDFGTQEKSCDEHRDPNTQWCSFLYGVLPASSLSVILNIFFIFRFLLNKMHKGQNQQEKSSEHLSTEHTTTNREIYDNVEDNPGYQELGQLSLPSCYVYDQLH